MLLFSFLSFYVYFVSMLKFSLGVFSALIDPQLHVSYGYFSLIFSISEWFVKITLKTFFNQPLAAPLE